MQTNFGDERGQIVTFTFFRYRNWRKIWAMSQMQLAHKSLSKTAGLGFYKLLGSGAGNGFSIKPDFSVYALLGVWKSAESAENFFQSSLVFNRFKKKSSEHWTVFMRATKARGSWSSVEPFNVSPTDKAAYGLTAVLTRATIHPRLALKFWRSVPRASEEFPNQPGLIFAKGVGELPLVEQATFSLWQSKQAMTAYAYRDGRHTEVIRKTRELAWYKEELFAEFQPFRSEGFWNGVNPLAEFLSRK